MKNINFASSSNSLVEDLPPKKSETSAEWVAAKISVLQSSAIRNKRGKIKLV